ncbi:hypothetical protein CU309_09130 [Prochlorococcus marinus str. MU1405]|nr:hypothetical protein [Prochlorococcus marinus str. MU1405]MBW3048463.1 hypothetical protein [Prochlorococcus marinus str. MU1406]
MPKKKVYYPKLKKIGSFSKKKNSKIFDYLTFLNLGVLKNIILILKNKIEIVRTGKIKSIKSELTREGILPKIKCI